MIAVVDAVLCGYLLGSIPVSLLLARLSGGPDLREYGSGKTGFTNSLRVLGARRSVLVFAGDFLKGFAAVELTTLYTDDPWARALAGLAAVAGHVWPVFAGFRGGRGVLTGAGVLVAFEPLVLAAVAPVAVVALVVTKTMSVVSLTAALAAAVAFVAFGLSGRAAWPEAGAAVAGVLLIIAMHRANIVRLMGGEEPRIGQGGGRRATSGLQGG